MTIKGWTTLEFRDKHNCLLFYVNANTDSGFNMYRHILLNSYAIAGGRNMGAHNNVRVVNEIVANNKLKRRYLEISQTSSFTRDITAPNMYTNSAS